MRKLKKCFAVITAALITLTSIPGIVTYAANGATDIQYTDADKSNFKLSYGFYKAIGVVNEELNIDSTISRGSWADIIVRYFGREGSVESFKDVHFFEDYNSKYEKIGSVNLAADLGFMGEYDDGKFCPDVDVSFDDVCMSVVKGLGYEFMVEIKGGGVDNYITVADEIGLLRGVTVSEGYPIVASSAFKILDNALKIEIYGKVVGKDEIGTRGDTVLSKIHKLRVEEGIVTSNFRSSLYNSSKTPVGQVGIDNVTYNYSGNTDGYLGYKVRYYIETTGTDTVVYMGKVKNEVQVIKFDDVFDYQNRTYYYFMNNSSREYEWEIPRECAVIYNGTAITDGYVSNLPMYTENGSLTLINNDTDVDIDVLLIEAYTDMWIGHIDAETQTIYSFYDEKDYISLKNYDLVELFDSYGAETTLSKLSVKNVLSLAKTPDGKSIRIDVCTDTVEGKINGKKSNDGKTTLRVDDIDYRASVICDTKDVSMGFTGVFYLNSKQQIVGCEEKLLTPAGYMLKASLVKGAEDKVVMRILTSKGQITAFECAEEVKVVGKAGKYTCDDLYELLLNKQETVKAQVILYELNDAGEIISLDLIGHSDRIREWTTVTGASYRSGASCFTDGKTFLNGTAVIFYIPMNGGSTEDYGVLYKSDLQDEQQYSSAALPAKSYQVNGSELGVDILVIDESFRVRKGGLGIVSSITQSIDENDELCHEIGIYQYGNLNKYIMYDGEIDINAIPAHSSAYKARKLEVGDVVGIDYLPSSGKRILSKLSIIYDISTDEYLTTNPSVKEHTGITRFFIGDVQKKDNKLMTVVINGGTTTYGKATTVGEKVDITADNYEIHPIGGTIYRYDTTGRKDSVVKGSINDIGAYESVGEHYSTIWMFTSKEAPQMIYVVNK